MYRESRRPNTPTPNDIFLRMVPSRLLYLTKGKGLLTHGLKLKLSRGAEGTDFVSGRYLTLRPGGRAIGEKQRDKTLIWGLFDLAYEDRYNDNTFIGLRRGTNVDGFWGSRNRQGHYSKTYDESVFDTFLHHHNPLVMAAFRRLFHGYCGKS